MNILRYPIWKVKINTWIEKSLKKIETKHNMTTINITVV